MDLKRIKETSLYVGSLERTREFYATRLGLPVIGFAEGRHVFFRVGESVLLCFDPETTRRETRLPAHYGSGWIHLAFEVSPDAYEDWKNKIKKAGVKILAEETWSNDLRSFYFRDPDGHLLEIAQESIWSEGQKKGV